MTDPATAAEAIQAYCLHCSFSIPLEVKVCPIHDCQLWPWRSPDLNPNSEKRKRLAMRLRSKQENPREA